MKLPIAFSLLILAAAAVFGWHDHQRLARVRETHHKLVAEAAALGIAPDPAHPTERVRITRHSELENKQAAAKLAFAKFIAFAKEMEELKERGERPDKATQKQIVEFMDLMMSLDAAQLKTLIADMCAAPDIKDETRQRFIGLSIITLANDHPQAALAIFTESADLFKDSFMGDHVMMNSLANWAKNDPLEALEWVRKNGERFPDLVNDRAKQGLISGVAAQDPKLALELIDELGLKDASQMQMISGIAEFAKSPKERTAMLATIREHCATLTDETAREEAMGSAITSLAHSAAEEGFASATQWIADSDFSPKEFEKLADWLSDNVKRDETGQWVEWLGETLPTGKADNSIRSMVNNWTRNDYQAAGTWLANAADGPTKQTAVRSYAETIARCDPETAAQWALTLPAGKNREETLQHIHRNLPKDDDASKAAAEAFAKKHGIE